MRKIFYSALVLNCLSKLTKLYTNMERTKFCPFPSETAEKRSKQIRKKYRLRYDHHNESDTYLHTYLCFFFYQASSVFSSAPFPDHHSYHLLSSQLLPLEVNVLLNLQENTDISFRRKIFRRTLNLQLIVLAF